MFGRERILQGLPEAKAIAARTMAFFKGMVDTFPEEIANFGAMPTLYAGLVDAGGGLQLYDGSVRFVGADGKVVVEAMPAEDYQRYIGEASASDSYLKAPYFKPLGYPEGIYRVGPLARLNVATHCGTPGRRRIRRIPSAVRPGGADAFSTSTTLAGGNRVRARAARGAYGRARHPRFSCAGAGGG